ncbi:YhcH/YjgK/YiaL family protein [Eubacteriales bacterium OttesenSCG-928-N13]|nr:YhcH/YjgK/YiaL family protein [Eubacteriales bacterium OttesenSCG-928-N13]
MILDQWSNLGRYAAMGSGFETAARFLAGKKPEDFAPGKMAVDGERVYLSVREADLTDQPERWEAHRRYADIQILLDGSEAIMYAPATQAAPSIVYVKGDDIEFYEGIQGLRCALKPGDFMILFPGELHAPDRPEGPNGHSKKLIVKVLMEKDDA